MDFDEYDYLEKTVETDAAKEKQQPAAGNGARSNERDRSRSSRHRASVDDGGDRDSVHRSKRAKSEDGSRHRPPSPTDHRRERDGERERPRSERDHRDDRNGKPRDREKERDKEKEERSKVREWESERERERSRRSRSHSERRHERSKEREPRERESKEREPKEKEPKERERDPRRYKEKKEEVAEPEADPERDQRTVFAYQICLKADERDVYEFFSRAGKVRDVRLIMDRNSRRSKGVGYIEFYDALSVPMAIALSGQPLLGQPVMVKPSEAEKNLVQSTATGAGSGGLSGLPGGARKLYVGNLHLHITDEQLRKVFEPFGDVELVQLPRDDNGQCRGYAFIQFAKLEDARAALSLNGQLEIAGKIIKVSAVTDQGPQDIGTTTGDLDDDEGGGLSLNARSRALLMQKLDRSGTATSVGGALVSPAAISPALTLPTASVLGMPPTIAPLLSTPLPAAALGVLQASPFSIVPTFTPPVEVPSECLMLKNMFDPNAETEPDFDLDIKEDVQDECSKFGAVKHIFVDKNSVGHVYLRFESANSAVNAQRALHGRWFAGKMITATYMLPQQYDAKFPNNS